MSISPSHALRSAPSSQSPSISSSLEHGPCTGTLLPLHAETRPGNHLEGSGTFHNGPELHHTAQETAPESTAGVSESVNAASEESWWVSGQLGRPPKGQEIVGRSANETAGQQQLDHNQSSGNDSTYSGGLSMAFGASQPHYGRLSGRSGGGYVEQSNAGNSSLQASNASSRGRKGQLLNANHLLNFQYDPIRRTPMRNPPPRRQQRIKPYNKDLFLQANFRFLVSDLGDYVLNSSNPDKMLQWEDVAAVKFSSSVPVQCPICLESPPLCPQITTCGHIFCFPCVLRYLLMGEEDHKGDCWKKCPLCSTVISCKDLHTVSISSVKHFQVGDYIDFTLLARAKSSVIPFEKNQYMFGALPYSKDGQCNSFSKFTLTSDAESSASMASLELTRWVHRVQSEGGEDLELLPYVYAATDQLEQRKKAWTEHRASESLNSSPPMGQRIVAQAKAGHSKFPFHGSNEYDKSGDLKIDRSEADTQSMKVRFGGAKSETVGIEMASTDIKDESTVTDRFVLSYSGASDGRKLSGRPVKCNANFSELLDDEDKESDKSSQKHKDIQCLKNNQLYKHQCEKSESVDEDSYYFYQSADGQSLVLHPLNMKCLLHHYGSHDMLPSSYQLNLRHHKGPSSTPHPWVYPDRERSVAAAAVQARPILQEFTASIHDDKPPSSSDFEVVLGGPKSASVSPPVFSELKLFSRVTRLGFAAGHDAPSLREDQSGGFSPGSSAFASKVTNIETVGHSSESGSLLASETSQRLKLPRIRLEQIGTSHLAVGKDFHDTFAVPLANF